MAFQLYVKKGVFKTGKKNDPFCLFFFLEISSSVQALMGIKAFLVDPHGVLDNWDEAAVDPCSWNMVTCSSDGLVIGL